MVRRAAGVKKSAWTGRATSGCQSLSLAAIGAWCHARNASVSVERVGLLVGMLGFSDVDNFLQCGRPVLERHLGRLSAVTAGEESCVLFAHAHFGAQIAQAQQGGAAESGADRRDEREEVEAVLTAAGMSVDAFRDVSAGVL